MPARKPKPGESFGDLFPEIAKQWHPTKNGNLNPFDFSKGSDKKVWWKCHKGEDHEWIASIGNRSNGRGCPICAGKIVVKSNSLATTNPDLSKEWHPTKNGVLKPINVLQYSHKKVWWKCDKGDDHEWLASVSDRSNGNGCAVCHNRKVVKSNSLATTNPDLAKQWHPTKNGKLTPFNFVAGSGKKVWWKCDKGDEHEWIATISNRNNGRKCPICSGNKVIKSISLATTHPELVKEWHPVKNNGLLHTNFTKGSGKKVWWKCAKGDDHEWEEKIVNRTKNKHGCTICSGRKVVISNCINNTHPEISKEWHPTKNGKLTPFHFTAGSNKSIWWKCGKGIDHEWKTSCNDRTRGRGCPVCASKKVVKSNCLATTYPDLAKQWHPTKNNNLSPQEVLAKSNKKIWWTCHVNTHHVWRSLISSRTRGLGCPYCTLTPQSKEELIITHELITIFKGINPKGFKTRVKGKLRSIDIYIPDLKLGIEFDGSYWHKDKRALDKLKTEELEAEGFNIIRVRQKPLKRIFKDDVMADKKYDGKKITNDILTQIMKDYKLGQSTILKINKYIEMPNLQNEKGLDKYIDMILTEKSKRK